MLATSVEPIAATYVGSFAGALTTLSFLPQVVRVYKLRSAHDLSYGYLGMFATGVAAFLLGAQIWAVRLRAADPLRAGDHYEFCDTGAGGCDCGYEMVL